MKPTARGVGVGGGDMAFPGRGGGQAVAVGLPARTAPMAHPPTVGLLAQVAVLAAVGTLVGLGPVAWLAGGAYAVAAWTLLSRALRQPAVRRWGPADSVTLARAVLVGGVTALVAESFVAPAPVAALASLATVALLLDAVDGRVARRTGATSRLGARFDTETDAFLVLVLSVYLATSLGWWVLALGLPHYAFAVAGLLLPWLRAATPPRRSRKTVAALQGIVLVVASAGLLPVPLVVAALLLTLGLLGWSFGRDIDWLWRRRVAARRLDQPEADVDGTHGRWRPAAARLVTVVAALLVAAALVLPNQLHQLTPAAFLRIPVEGLLVLAVLLVLPPRPRRVAALVAGVAIGLLAIAKVLDMGFFEVLARPFDPVLDWTLLGAAAGFLTEAMGRAGATAIVIAAVVGAVAVIVLLALSMRRLTRPMTRHRRAAAGAVGVLAVAWIALALVGVHAVPGVPVAAHEYDRLLQVGASLQDRRAFAEQAAVDAFGEIPEERLLTALRGKDVVVAFVESYGRDAIGSPDLAARVGAVLDDGDRRLDAAGFEARSGYLTAPTVGGVSWLSHATLLSGLWVDNQQRYRTLLASDRMTLNRAFARAGWRTVAVMPGIWEPWPEGAFFGYHEVHRAADLGYRGPRTNWGIIPDQYTMAAFQALERERSDRTPVMATIPLISSHAPWTPLPRMVEWGDIGDGSGFEPGDGPPVDQVWNDPGRVRAQYAQAVEYSLRTLISYVETYGDDDLVLILLGDHQAPRVVIGDDPSHDVPISIVTGDPAVLERISGWGWHDGLTPGPQAPVTPMDAFRDQFLTAFGPPDGTGASAPARD